MFNSDIRERGSLVYPHQTYIAHITPKVGTYRLGSPLTLRIPWLSYYSQRCDISPWFTPYPQDSLIILLLPKVWHIALVHPLPSGFPDYLITPKVVTYRLGSPLTLRIPWLSYYSQRCDISPWFTPYPQDSLSILLLPKWGHIALVHSLPSGFPDYLITPKGVTYRLGSPLTLRIPWLSYYSQRCDISPWFTPYPQDSLIILLLPKVWHIALVHPLPSGFPDYLITPKVVTYRLGSPLTLRIPWLSYYSQRCDISPWFTPYPQDSLIILLLPKVWHIALVHSLPSGFPDYPITPKGVTYRLGSPLTLRIPWLSYYSQRCDISPWFTPYPQDSLIIVLLPKLWHIALVHSLPSGFPHYLITPKVVTYRLGSPLTLRIPSLSYYSQSGDISPWFTPYPQDSLIILLLPKVWHIALVHPLPSGFPDYLITPKGVTYRLGSLLTLRIPWLSYYSQRCDISPWFTPYPQDSLIILLLPKVWHIALVHPLPSGFPDYLITPKVVTYRLGSLLTLRIPWLSYYSQSGDISPWFTPYPQDSLIILLLPKWWHIALVHSLPSGFPDYPITPKVVTYRLGSLLTLRIPWLSYLYQMIQHQWRLNPR